MAELTRLEQVIVEVDSNKLAFCKFLATNDTIRPKSHQCGVYIPNVAAEKILFGHTLHKGENIKLGPVRIVWQGGDARTDSMFTYYGATKDECRITQFGRGFPFLRDGNIGDLFVLVQMAESDYSVWLLSTEEEIEGFLDYFGMSPTETNRLIERRISAEHLLDMEMDAFLRTLDGAFPSAKVMSDMARSMYEKIFDHVENVIRKPDKTIIRWIDTEYALFAKAEEFLYGDLVYHGFHSMESFVGMANSILNRRKSRAGKSLENHLAAIFDGNHLHYEAQVKSEGNKRPDFIFPGSAAYHDTSYAAERLVFLGAKTTCKDRWRQVINEADRIPVKHLFTLQQGISSQQLQEMLAERVQLVVPHDYIKSSYPKEYRKSIMDLATFISFVREKTA